VQPSSGPNDEEGLYYRVNGASNRLGALAVQAASRDPFDESRDTAGMRSAKRLRLLRTKWIRASTGRALLGATLIPRLGTG
jgi:hypothetical protein